MLTNKIILFGNTAIKILSAGEIEKVRLFEDVVKKIKAVNLPTLKSYARALSNANSIEEAFTYMIK